MNAQTTIPFGEEAFHVRHLGDARIVIFPVCYEHAPSYGTGSGDGPRHILEASVQLECLDEETMTEWSKCGIHTMPLFYPENRPEKAMNQIRAEARRIMENKKRLLSLGGDHAVSIGVIGAAADVYPDIGVLQVDAHADLRNEWNGSRFNHGCVMRRVIDDFGLPVVQVGIRACSPEEREFMVQNNIEPFFAHDLAGSDDNWIKGVSAALPDRIYFTIDLDGLDPSVIPGTGTPEPGGLTYRQLLKLIKAVGNEKEVVAADITELAKIDGTRVSEYTAARIAEKLIVYCWA